MTKPRSELIMKSTLDSSLDPSRYRWVPRRGTVGTYRRRALAGENVWIQKSPDVRQLFLGGSLSLSSSAPDALDNLCIHAATKKAWWQVRCEYPTIAATWHCDDDGDCWIDCSAPEPAVAEAWLERTVSFGHSRECTSSFSSLRKRVIEMKEEGRIEDAGILCLHALENGLDSRISKVDFLLNLDHTATDGIGIRILAGKFLENLARELGRSNDHKTSRQKVDLDWKHSDNITDLPSPWMDHLNGDQLMAGRSYEKAVQRQWNFLMQDCANSQYGLPLLPKSTKVTKQQQKTWFRSFSTTQSKTLLKCVKTELGPLATVTHLGHAAMILVTLNTQTNDLTSSYSTNPPTTPFSSPCWINGRLYLRQDEPTSSYTPVCQALGEVVLPVSVEHIIQMNESPSKDKETIVQAAKAVSQSYQTLRRRKSILSESVPLMEWLGQEIFKNRVSRDTTETVARAAPFFLSDGITERYISQEYHDTSESGTMSVFIVDSIHFAANAEGPNLIVRMSSWRNVITLSAEWRSEQYTDVFVKEFLEEMAHLMLSIND